MASVCYPKAVFAVLLIHSENRNSPHERTFVLRLVAACVAAASFLHWATLRFILQCFLPSLSIEMHAGMTLIHRHAYEETSLFGNEGKRLIIANSAGMMPEAFCAQLVITQLQLQLVSRHFNH